MKIRTTDKRKPGGLQGNERLNVEGMIGSNSDKYEVWDASVTDIAELSSGVTAYQGLTSSGGNVSLDTKISSNAKITLTENTTINLTNLKGGVGGNIIIVQGATDYTITITPTPYVIDDGKGITSIATGNGTITILSYSYDGTNLYMNYGFNYTNA
ncbi:MAG: hypothetical protein GY775_19330 [Candidatus Scalindua sp.]|nr:hypothetical protein [Candidatus Scalindua sp.]